MNLSMLLQMAADGMGQRIALGSREDGLCYAGMLAGVQRIAAWMARRDGTNVVFLGLNSPAFPLALFASAAAGKTFVPLNYRLPDAALARLCARCAPALAIVDEDLLPRVPAIPGLNVVTREAFLASGAEPSGNPAADNDIALLLFTSGTTGEPKAAVLRHRHLTSYVLQSVEFAAAGEDEAALVSVPPYHIAGVSAALTSVYGGRRTVQLPGFTPQDWVATVQRERITHAMLVPTMLGRILDEVELSGAVLESLRHMSYGGGRMPAAVIERALRLLPGVDFVNAYGLTETSSTIAVLGPEDHRTALASADPAARRRLGSVGRPLPNLELSIRDADGQTLAADRPGEIWVRGEQVSGEYVGRRALRDDGWLPTQDCGWLDADGYLYVDGRLDDVIVRGGENISPGEVEDVLRTHPAVEDVAVIGLPDDEWGEKVAAVVVVSTPVESAALSAWVANRLRSTKAPQDIHFRNSLPYNETGKLLRRALKQELSRMQAIAPGVFEQGPEGVHLLAGRHRHGGPLVFPLPQGSASHEFETIRLSPRGRLWSWTVQRFRPKAPFALPTDQEFTPYAVGYVELPDELIVESRLRVDDFSSLKIGQELELVIEPLFRNPAGVLLTTYAFRPLRR